MTNPGATLGPDPDDPLPWEGPEALRRDVEPHRGNLLLLLAGIVLVLGVSSLFVVVPGWLAVPFGVVLDRLTGHDWQGRRGATGPRRNAKTPGNPGY
jgi:hypothetical protein